MRDPAKVRTGPWGPSERNGPTPGAGEDGGPGAVLLVEDEAIIRGLLIEILKRDGYLVLAASSGPEALSVAATHAGPIRLVVTDVIMPGLDGRELAERLAEIRPGIRVLYISGYATDEVLQRGVLPTDTAFLQKPFAPQEFLRKVREVLDEPR